MGKGRTFTGKVFVDDQGFTPADIRRLRWSGSDMIELIEAWIEEWHWLDSAAMQELQEILEKGKEK